MNDGDTYHLLQVWSETKQREFWDCAVFKRGKDEKEGVAHFIESTPGLSWMEGKPFDEVWYYLVKQRKSGKLLFSITEESGSVRRDLFPSSSR
jgi:hypothetical protein